ncbi:protein of unknown function [Variovorax sp. NFACC28]|nr:protein of unknown function [Variovorax sp. NFACC28]SEF98664.1 protein of unknown function [Variovorax sp. NFACC29]SFB94037.1 protein of unknown function [Variovorax sp. NFACC26]SFF81486.1 protein of unknown function [Variovorax sp. NFACC27]
MGEVPRNHYIVNGQPVAMPMRPSADHVFDWSTHTWRDPRSVADLRANLKAEIARRRWELEVAGLSMSDGLQVGTRREDRAALAAAIADMAQTGIEEIDFKTPGGFRRVTRKALQEAAKAVALHVQVCFSAEAAHDALIDSITERSALLHYPLADFPAVPSTVEQAS